jgi:hypothetical protein
MNTQINEVLTKMRNKLNGEAAWESLDATGGAAGELEAENVSEANEKVDTYLLDCVEALMGEYDIEEEDAWDFVFSVADMAAEEGLLPELPEEEDTDEALINWLGKAGTVGFKALVLQAAGDQAE